MRILHLANHCRFANGNVHVAVDLACEQVKQGHQVFFASSGGFFEDLLRANGVQHVTLDQDGRRLYRFPRLVAQLRSILGTHDIEIMHAHMMTGALLGAAARKFTGIPLVTTVHNAFDWHSVLMGVGTRVIAVSDAVRRSLNDRGVSNKKLRVVLNGTMGSSIRAAFADSGSELQVPQRYILTVCGLHPRKGVPDLITAFEILAKSDSDLHLLIIGNGPYREPYEKLASVQRANSRIKFLGALKDPMPYIRMASVFVLASHADPCPLVISEAREAGCAIVATNVDGIPEMLEFGRAGRLVSPKAPNEIAEAIQEILSDPKVRKMYVDSALSGAEHFHISRVTNETFSVYREALADLDKGNLRQKVG